MSKEIDYKRISLQVGQIFTPNTPINEKDMFSGRLDQVRKVIDVIFQNGQHAIIFGDRGVGKTSFANVLSFIISPPTGEDELLCVRINCDTTDTFTSTWNKAFEKIELIKQDVEVGFGKTTKPIPMGGKDLLPKGDLAPDDIRKALISVSNFSLPIIIIDEFDRLPENVKKIFADLIKTLSDNSLKSTIILIGVG